MNIGLDIHGCIDIYPDLFRQLTYNWMVNKHKVYVITGMPWADAKSEVTNYKISYTGHYSIVDYHRKAGTKMWQDKKGRWWTDDDTWNRSKGDFIHRRGIVLHFDDSWKYGNWIPETCTFVLVPKKGFNKFMGLMFNLFA